MYRAMNAGVVEEIERVALHGFNFGIAGCKIDVKLVQ